jgi:hypothetical protein
MDTPDTYHFGVCVRNDGSEDLQLLKLYQILPDESAARNGLLRIIDDSGEDYLYPAASFIPISLPSAVEQVLAEIPASTTTR